MNSTPEADYLIGDQIVEEPHSFDVAVAAEWKDKKFHWNYSHVEARVEIPDAMLKNMDIEIMTAGPETIRPTLKLPGEIIYNEHTVVLVVPRLPGIVTAVYRHHGQEVKKGEVLAVIESQMLADLRSQYLVAGDGWDWREPPSNGKSGCGKRRLPPSRTISLPRSC